VGKTEVTESKSSYSIYTTWKRPTPKKVGIYSVSTPKVLTGIKWSILEYFPELDEKELLTLRPFSKEFIQFIAAGAMSHEKIVQDMARSILLKIGGEAVPVLGEAIIDKHLDNDKKLILARLLGEIGDKRGIAPLFQVLKDVFDREEIFLSPPYYAVVAVEALEKIAGKDLSFPDENSRIAFYIGHLNRVNREVDRREVIDSLYSYMDNDRVARLLLNYMHARASLELQHYIGSKFVKTGDHRVVEPLEEIMARDSERARSHSTNESVKLEERKVAAKLLGDLGGKEAERILIDAILNDSKEVRQSARDALIKIGNPNIVKPLAEGINMKKNEYKKRLNKQAYEQAILSLDEAYEVLRMLDKRPRTWLDNLLGRRKY